MYTFTVQSHDLLEIKTFSKALDFAIAVSRSRDIIRNRLKHGEGLSTEEESILEQIREELSFDL